MSPHPPLLPLIVFLCIISHLPSRGYATFSPFPPFRRQQEQLRVRLFLFLPHLQGWKRPGLRVCVFARLCLVSLACQLVG